MSDEPEPAVPRTFIFLRDQNEELQAENNDLREQLRKHEKTAAKDTPRQEMPTPEQIVLDLFAGKITPPEASVALYALQVSQTAERNAYLIAATRQKEERLRNATSTKNSPTPSMPARKPRRASPKPATQPTKRQTPANARSTGSNSSRSRTTSQDAGQSQTHHTPAAKREKAKPRNRKPLAQRTWTA